MEVSNQLAKTIKNRKKRKKFLEKQKARKKAKREAIEKEQGKHEKEDVPDVLIKKKRARHLHKKEKIMQWKDEELNKMLPFVSESTLKIKVINSFKNKQNMDVFVFSGKRKEHYYEEWVLFLQKLNGIAIRYNWTNYYDDFHYHPLFKVTKEALTRESLVKFERNILNDRDV